MTYIDELVSKWAEDPEMNDFYREEPEKAHEFLETYRKDGRVQEIFHL